MERARVAVSTLSDNSLTRLPQLVELLRQCVSENTILCLSRLQAKLFSIVTACRQFGRDVFVPRRTSESCRYIVIVSDAADTDSLVSCLMVHSSFNVLSRSTISDISTLKSTGALSDYHLLILRSNTLEGCLSQNILSLQDICFLVFNECHLALVDDNCASILRRYKSCHATTGIQPPLICAVTTVLSTMYIEDSLKLEQFLSNLGNFFAGRINVDRTMLSSKYSPDAKLKEQLIVCGPVKENLRVSLEQEIDRVISPFIATLRSLFPQLSDEKIAEPTSFGAAKMACHALEAVREILYELGPFCAAKLAENFIDQLEQHYSCHVPDVEARKVMVLSTTTMRVVCQIVDTFYANNVLCLEDIIPLVPKKVMAFLQEFKKWMPNIDFKITPAATLPFDENKKKKSKSGNSLDEDDDDTDTDTDFSDDMSSDSSDGGAGKGLGSDMPGCTPVDPSTFRRHRRQATIRMMKQIIDGTALSALVVVKTPYEAYALSMLIDEICKYDADLFFLKVGHYASLALQETSAKSLLLAPPARLFLKYQSNVLHRFRQRRLNVLVTTDLHGTSVTLPPINHVVRLSVPFTYESYIGSKSFCQTQNSVMTVIVDENSADSTQTMLRVFRETENVLLNHCLAPAFPSDLPIDTEDTHNPTPSPNSGAESSSRMAQRSSAAKSSNTLIQPFYPSGNAKDSAKVTADNAIMIVNRYCAKLPSDVFTRLTSLLEIETISKADALAESDRIVDQATAAKLYRASITLPVISPIKKPISGALMPSQMLALKSAAVEACRVLFQQGELDEKLNPVTFEVWKCEDLRQEELQLEAAADSSSANKPSSSGVSVAKRKQIYVKKLAEFLTSGPVLLKEPSPVENGDASHGESSTPSALPLPPPPCRLYQIRMRRVDAPMLTLVDRAYDADFCPRHYGFVATDGALPPLPIFPVFSRYCDLDVSFESLAEGLVFTTEELDLIRFFHRYVFHTILRIEKDVLFFQPEKSPIQMYVLPLVYEYANSKPKIDWDFIRSLKNFQPTVPGGLGTVLRRSGERFPWDRAVFEDAVVYRSYCGFVANDLYYVVNIRDDYSPKTPFPSDQYDDFVTYYEIKYRLMITNTTQPLLDVDHTTAHLNMVLPRRCSGKPVPTTDEENAQRLWFVPELCGIHPLPASMWHKAACLPTIFYRLNCLLVANETLHIINNALGLPCLTEANDDESITRRSLLEYSQLRTHQQAAIASQSAGITRWLPSEPLLNSQTATDPSRGVCADCLSVLDSVVFKTLWLYFKREPVASDSPSHTNNYRLSCLICHSYCDSEFHAIAHLRHRHSWLYTQQWFFKADSTCPLCQAMTAALRLSHSQLQPCEQPISAIHCACASDESAAGLCGHFANEWESLRSKISYLSKSLSRPPNMCDILTALTASNANDMFSYERLETVGDSFLKFTVTAFLYCSCPGVEEGKLTYMRSRQVSNLNLYYRGRSRELAERIFVSKFEPSEAWLPPGYVCIRDGELEKVCDPTAVWKGPEEEAKVIAASADLITTPTKVFTNGHSVENGTEPTTNEDAKENNKIEDTHEKIVTNGNVNNHHSDNDEDVEEKKEVVGELPGPSMTGRGRGGRGRGRRGRGRGRGRGGQQQQQKAKLKSDDSDDDSNDGDLMRKDGQLKAKSSPHKDLMTLHTHQSLSDKNIADCVEALIAAYLVTAGHQAALHVISWFGIKVLPLTHSLESGRPVTQCVGDLPAPPAPLLDSADRDALMKIYHCNNLKTFESLIGYHFHDKAYLVQAFCHASFDLFTRQRLTDSYQRLELLGDAILDYLITRHMYELHSHYSPGVLTDLRSALVNNNIFSSLAVKWSFHRFLLYASPGLFNVVVDFVNLHKQHGSDLDLEKLDELEESGEALECPKVLGDIFESVAGAIYLDSGLSLETVWLVYYRMLKPVIDEYTANIPKSPVRELLEREPETARFLRPERTIDGRVKVIVNVVDKGQFTGVGRNFRLAKNAAARRALRQIKSSNA